MADMPLSLLLNINSTATVSPGSPVTSFSVTWPL